MARADGLLAVGGDLDPRRVLLAYANGIFPWYSEGQPILWHSPDPRFVLFPPKLHVGRSLRKVLRQQRFELTLDRAFEEVIQRCAETPRPDQKGTWITRDMGQAYTELHQAGFAHSAETWLNGKLVAGLYGVALGKVFFGESMYTTEPNGSKVAFVALVHQLRAWDYELVDSQIRTRHLERFGGEEIPRDRYLEELKRLVSMPMSRDPWRFGDDVLSDLVTR